LLTVQTMAQSENKGKELNKEKKQMTTNQEIINIPIQPVGIEAKMMLPDNKQNEPKTSFDTTSNSLKIRVPHICYGNNDMFPISNKIFFYVEGDQKRYLNLANYNLAYLALGWRFNSNLNLTGGLLAIKQFTNASLLGVDRSGFRFNVNYSITNQLDFNIWGQYITGSSINSSVDNLLPQTGAGASMVLNLGGGSQFGVGAEYKKDENKEKWNYNAGGKLKLNF
jgi:hypothetical protein